MTRTPRITTICFPRDDSEFSDQVLRELADHDGSEPTPDSLTARLRASFPLVSVVPREPFADLWRRGEDLWYVYRDGGVLARQASSGD